jgi:hypothetical protein
LGIQQELVISRDSSFVIEVHLMCDAQRKEEVGFRYKLGPLQGSDVGW